MSIDKLQFDQGETNFNCLIQRVLEAVRNKVEMEFGFISEFANGDRVFRFTDGNLPDISPGDRNRLADSYCYYVACGAMPKMLQNAADNAIAVRLDATRTFPVGSHLSVPIQLANGSVFGTICCFSRTTSRPVSDDDLNALEFGAKLVATILDTADIRREDYLASERQVSEVIENRAIQIVYQPILRLADSSISSFEALSRFPHSPHIPVDKWFLNAERVGLTADLEFLAIEEAMAGFLSLPQPCSVSLNLSPESISSNRFCQLFDVMPLDKIILEVTEHAAIDSYDTLRSRLAPLRARGLRLAIDDVGAGYSSFRHVLDLAPDLIKLDVSLIRNIDQDLGRQALVEAIGRFGSRLSSEVVAEGVETDEELAVLQANGVTKVQGYLLSKPLALEQAVAFSNSFNARASLNLRTRASN